MNSFQEIFNFCLRYEDVKNPVKRRFAKEEIACLVSDIVGVRVSKEDIKVFRKNDIGILCTYRDVYNKVRIFKLTFSMQTYKAYIYDGSNSYEFKVLKEVV